MAILEPLQPPDPSAVFAAQGDTMRPRTCPRRQSVEAANFRNAPGVTCTIFVKARVMWA